METTFKIVVLPVTIIFLCHFNSFVTARQRRPNVVFILADDYGFHDIGYHGSEFATPNLDKLAADGVKLENYYVQPICSPTRSQLMTGKYQIHTGLQHGIIWNTQPYGLPLTDPTIANFLKDQGYSTHAIGKWHLGLYKKEYTPLNRGFDSFYGFWGGGEDYYTHYTCDGVHNKTMDIDEEGTGGEYCHAHIQAGKYQDTEKWCGYDLRDMNEPVTDMNGTYSTYLYTRKALDVIKNASAGDKPFFMYLAFQAVHSPLEVPAKYMRPYAHIKDKRRRTYAGMVSCMDEGVGNITRALKVSGLWDNTILIFSTDNGGQVHAGSSNWPLRGNKNTLWEGGVRGIGFVTGPVVGRKGQISEELMHVSDWFPTIADMVGSKVNKSMKLDGYNQWPMISQGKKSHRHEILHNIDILMSPKGERMYNDSFDTRVRAAIRMRHFKLLTGDPGDDRWYPPSPMGPKSSGSTDTQNVWLFNVKKDPCEIVDLSRIMVDQVKLMLDRLSALNATAVPPLYPPSDPRCDPQEHGGFWGPWE